MRTFGRFMIASTIVFALSACGKKDETPIEVTSEAAVATDAAPAAMPTPGVYDVSDAAGKKVLTATINADGTYADVLASGQRIAGIVKMVDGKTCFDPSGKAPADCFTDSAPGADGSFTATDSKGTVLTVRPQAK